MLFYRLASRQENRSEARVPEENRSPGMIPAGYCAFMQDMSAVRRGNKQVWP